MKLKRIIFMCLPMVLLLSCDTNITSKEKSEKGVRMLTEKYQPPIFMNDQRISKITEIAPEIHQILAEHALEKKIPGVAYGIVVDDSVLVASAIGMTHIGNKTPATINSAFRIASMTKSFTAMAILKLRDEGHLSLGDPVAEYIPEMENTRYLTTDSPDIDIENLLTMTAGFPEDNPWGDRQLAVSDADLMALVEDGISVSKPPSLAYEYSNTGYAMLGHIITKVSGIPYQEYINKNILLPLGMDHTYWEYSDIPEGELVHGYRWEDEQWKDEPILHDGAYGSMGGLITSITDFSKYVRFHLSAWPARSGEDHGPIKRSSLREMHNPQFSFLNSWNTDWNDEACASRIGYGYGLGISQDCKRIIRVSHGGALPGYGSNYVFYPEYGIGIMAFGNRTYTRPIPYDAIEKLLFETQGIQPRSLPISDILAERKNEMANIILSWDGNLDQGIFADNLFMDTSKDKRTNEIQGILDKAGALGEVLEINPRNQLRGDFRIQAEKGSIRIFFTLTPQKEPKIQQLDFSFEPND